MNILITGGAGFIGSNLAFEIKKIHPNYRVTIFDKFNTRERRDNDNFKYFGDYKNILGLKAEIIVGDLANLNDVKKLLKKNYDIIFHQGAISDTTVLNQEEVINTNASSFREFLDYSHKNQIKLIYASSAGTYGNTIAPNIVGKGEIPENVYGYSKLMMDEMTRKYLNDNCNNNIIGLKYFNVFGPGELYKRRTSSMILQLAKQAIDKNKVRLFKYGEQTRDFVYIKDVVNANLNAIEGISGIYNVGSGVSRSFNDIVSILEKTLERKIEIEYFENPYTFYQNNTCADLSNSHSGINYYPEFALEEGIADYTNEILGYTQNEWKYFYE
jgi:ADP-L-glycero-D-manno-heptose 6-epimerase